MPIQTFSLVCKFYDSGQQIMPHISDYRKFIASVDIGDFQWLGQFQGSVSILSYFLAFFILVCKLYNFRLQIIPPISDHLKFMANVNIGCY